ncbi:hypothetical protein FQR65_LT03192 [Abscondita terminalis]|nr:hypothetical protein FQR65_LT03192 [Abscondita terminalis]
MYMNLFTFAVCALTLFNIGVVRPAITRDVKVDLPGTENINKRSAQNNEAMPESKEEIFPFNKRAADLKKEDDSMEMEENGLVFRPLFRTKEHVTIKRAKRCANENEDMKTDETGIVYVPLLFRSRDKLETKQRLRRSLNDEPVLVMQNPDDLIEITEPIVFKPLIRRKSRGARKDDDNIFGSRLMDLASVVFILVFLQLVSATNKVIRNDNSLLKRESEDMMYDECGMVFLPHFRNKNRNGAKRTKRLVKGVKARRLDAKDSVFLEVN